MATNYHGIDYGMGMANIDRGTGIRYAVIPLADLHEFAIKSFEADYGEPTCGYCGNALTEYDPDNPEHEEFDMEGGRGVRDYACETCCKAFDSEDAFSDEPQSWTLTEEGYDGFLDEHNDVWVTHSLYFTFAQYCSPCAPGACHLSNPTDRTGPRCYALGHEWFPDGRAPYPLWRVEDGSAVPPPEAK